MRLLVAVVCRVLVPVCWHRSAHRLAEMCKRRGLTQRQVAQAMGV
jgi:hypothetical protein